MTFASTEAGRESHPTDTHRIQEDDVAILKFQPFSSSVDSSFWVRYCREKLETIKLNESPIPIQASYATPSQSISSKRVSVGYNSFPKLQCQENSLLVRQQQQFSEKALTNDRNIISSSISDRVVVSGSLVGFNTLESFQKVDKNKLLRDFFLDGFLPLHDSSIRKDIDIVNNATISDDYKNDESSLSSLILRDRKIVESLQSFLLLTFADLKSHTVLYWFGIPALVPKSGPIVTFGRPNRLSSPTYWNDVQLSRFYDAFAKMQQEHSTLTNTFGLTSYFIYSPKRGECLILSTSSYASLHHHQRVPEDDKSSYTNEDEIQLLFGCLDPSEPIDEVISQNDSKPDGANYFTVGWPLRNMIAYLSLHLNLGGKIVQVLCCRRPPKHNSTTAVVNGDESIVLKVRVPTKEDYGWNQCSSGSNTLNEDLKESSKVVGWELNMRNKPGPRSVNLRPLLDSNHLAIEAADLNLKLMKWRMIPNLDVEKLQACKVLMIGAGTLGCSTARTLLGWGIRKIKFVDYGKVSYSNPVRQNLFTLEDCHADNGNGKGKAVAAADALRTIAADIQSEGISLSIPMPGHPVDNAADGSLQDTVNKLDQLVYESDVVFLLTDTRESRWLPTVMAAVHDKMLINAALGLDSWLVMRHGGGQGVAGKRYGCYFCNDVVAPENSTRNRTLDQQCTVTRPGLAPIASAMAAELMVALLHHPDLLSAPAPTPKISTSSKVNNTNLFSPTIQASSDASESSTSSPLGIIPHQIRGSLVTYTMMIPTVPAFKQCTGCSESIMDAYRHNKVQLVLQACESKDGSFLENLSGLADFRTQATKSMEGMENWDDDDDSCFDE